MASTTSKTGNPKTANATAANAKTANPKARQAKAVRVATPWGAANLVERLTVPQRAGERRFASLVELLETGDGERLVRFAYSTDGVGRRGPVTLRARDVERLHKELGRTPALAELLGPALTDVALGAATPRGEA
jgi:hypothetical protein